MRTPCASFHFLHRHRHHHHHRRHRRRHSTPHLPSFAHASQKCGFCSCGPSSSCAKRRRKTTTTTKKRTKKASERTCAGARAQGGSERSPRDERRGFSPLSPLHNLRPAPQARRRTNLNRQVVRWARGQLRRASVPLGEGTVSAFHSRACVRSNASSSLSISSVSPSGLTFRYPLRVRSVA